MKQRPVNQEPRESQEGGEGRCKHRRSRYVWSVPATGRRQRSTGLATPGDGIACPEGFQPRMRADETPLPGSSASQSPAAKSGAQASAPLAGRGFCVGAYQVPTAGGKRATWGTHSSNLLRDKHHQLRSSHHRRLRSGK